MNLLSLLTRRMGSLDDRKIPGNPANPGNLIESGSNCAAAVYQLA